MRSLVALPVFNEADHVDRVLNQVRQFASTILVVDDGSTDETPEILRQRRDVCVVRHTENRGYGASLKTAFDYAIGHGFECLVTIDCDGQHEPRLIPRFVQALSACDVVSGSRYLHVFDGDSAPPEDRLRINRMITAELKARLRLNLTDSFCGFKAYRVDALRRLDITESGYAMPLEFWVQASSANLRIRELPVPLIYLNEKRSFGGSLDHAGTRLEHYQSVIERSICRVENRVQTILSHQPSTR